MRACRSDESRPAGRRIEGDAVISANPSPPASLTVDEFLDWPQDDGAARWQLVEGEPVPLAPTWAIHAAIQANLATLLNTHLWEARPGHAALTGAAVLPRVRRDVNIRTPDLIVYRGLRRRGETVLDEPILAVEILSLCHSRQTWANIWVCCSLPSLQEVLIVRTASVAAEILRRNPDGSWPEDFQALGTTLRLDSIDCKCPLVWAYRGTELFDA